MTVIISLKRGNFRPKQVEGTIYRVRGKNGKITLKNVMGESTAHRQNIIAGSWQVCYD